MSEKIFSKLWDLAGHEHEPLVARETTNETYLGSCSTELDNSLPQTEYDRSI
jgi:hypothetical protein